MMKSVVLQFSFLFLLLGESAPTVAGEEMPAMGMIELTKILAKKAKVERLASAPE